MAIAIVFGESESVPCTLIRGRAGGIALVGAILAFFRCKPTSSVGLVASRQSVLYERSSSSAIGFFKFFFRAVFFDGAVCTVQYHTDRTALATNGAKSQLA